MKKKSSRYFVVYIMCMSLIHTIWSGQYLPNITMSNVTTIKFCIFPKTVCADLLSLCIVSQKIVHHQQTTVNYEEKKYNFKLQKNMNKFTLAQKMCPHTDRLGISVGTQRIPFSLPTVEYSKW